MNFSALSIQFLHGSCYLIPFLIIIFLLKSPRFNGFLGEFAIHTSIKHSLSSDQYHLLKDVTIPSEEGLTQLDHVVVSKYGVFVLETRNMKGWIFGSEREKTWTQKFYEYTSKFQNPLHQNFEYVKTLQHLLGLKNEQVHSLVVFIGDSTFKSEMPANVTKEKGYLKFIQSKTEVVLSEQEVGDIVSRIKQGRLVTEFKNAF